MTKSISILLFLVMTVPGICFAGHEEAHPLALQFSESWRWDDALWGHGHASDGNTLFYGGDFDSRRALSDERSNYRGASSVWENFVVPEPGWRVTALYVNLFFNYTSSTADYEIRSGVSAGNPGTRVAGASEVPATQVPTGRTWGGYNESTVKVDALDIMLQPGEYWLMVRSVTYACGGGWLLSRAATTSGANAVGGPIGDGNAYYSHYSYNFVPVSQVLGSGTWDFSYGIEGSVVPEPAGLIVLASGLAILARRRSRR